MSEATAEPIAARRVVAPRQPRHELPYQRPCDLPALLNISATSAWRLRQLAGFPEANPLGRYRTADVLTFVATLDRNALREARRAAAVRSSQRAADTSSIELPGVAHETGDGPPVRSPNRTAVATEAARAAMSKRRAAKAREA